MAYGVRIWPEDQNDSNGNKAIDITVRSRLPSWRASADVITNTQNGSTPFDVPNVTAGASVFVIPTRCFIRYFVGTSPNATYCLVDRFDITGSHVEAIIKRSNNNQPYANRFVKFNAYQITGAGGTGYGLGLIDSTDFKTITDTTAIGACVFRQRGVTVNGQWTVPDSVQGKANCVVFANWSDPNVVVTYDNDSKTIFVRSQNDTAASTSLNIAIFANNINMTPPKYGLAIFNQSGQCTFSSKYPPMLLRGTFTLAKGPDTQSTFNVYDGGTIDRPLVPLGIWGVWVFNGAFYEVFESGMRMNGQNLVTGQGRRIAQESSRWAGQGSINATMSLPLLNARDYFDGI